MASGKNGRLTQAEIDKIIEMASQNIPYRTIAAEVGCTKDTVSKHWRAYKAEKGKEIRLHHEEIVGEAAARFEKDVEDARLAFLQAKKDRDMTNMDRFLNTAIRAKTALAKIQGIDTQRIEIHGKLTVEAKEQVILSMAKVVRALSEDLMLTDMQKERLPHLLEKHLKVLDKDLNLE